MMPVITVRIIWPWCLLTGEAPLVAVAGGGRASLLCALGLSLQAASIYLSLQLLSAGETGNLLPEPQPHSSREPSCRKVCGGYNELGVYPGCPDLRPMTSSIKEVLHLSETVGPKPGTLRPGPASKQGPLIFTCFYLFS